jgi:hypothetical protein
LYCSIDCKESEGKCFLELDEDFWCSRSRPIWYVSLSLPTTITCGQEADIQVSWFYHEVPSPTTARRRKWQKGPKSTSVSFPPDRRFADDDIITTQKHAYTCRPIQASITASITEENSESRYNHRSEGVHLFVNRKDDTTAQLLISSHISYFLSDPARGGHTIKRPSLGTVPFQNLVTPSSVKIL